MNALRPLTEEDKIANSPYRVGALLQLTLSGVPPKYKPDYPANWILNQGEFEGNNDECGGVSSSRVLSILNGYHVGPHFLWMMARMRAGDKTEDFGVSNRDLEGALRHVGALRFEKEPFTFKDGRDKISNPANWGNLASYVVKAAEQATGGTTWVTKTNLDAFDTLRASIWALNKKYSKPHGAIFGLLWGWPMTDYFIDKVSDTGTGHDVAVIGWDGDYVIIMQSYGVSAGNSGEQKIHRTIFNKYAESFGCFIPIDATREQIDELIAKGGKLNEPFLSNIVRFFVSLLKKNLISFQDLIKLEEPLFFPKIETMNKLEVFCNAIKEHEGYFPNSRSFRNNNPGNFKFSKRGYKAIYGTVHSDPKGFAIFKDYATGWLYLKNFITNCCTDKTSVYQSTMTLTQFFKVYCEDDPTTPENDPVIYAQVVAKKLGVGTDFIIKDLLT